LLSLLFLSIDQSPTYLVVRIVPEPKIGKAGKGKTKDDANDANDVMKEATSKDPWKKNHRQSSQIRDTGIRHMCLLCLTLAYVYLSRIASMTCVFHWWAIGVRTATCIFLGSSTMCVSLVGYRCTATCVCSAKNVSRRLLIEMSMFSSLLLYCKYIRVV
jgi:hypothetical protein